MAYEVDIVDGQKEDRYFESTAIVILVVTVLSICGSILVIINYILLKELRNFALKMIVFLCIADLLDNLSMFLILPTQFANNRKPNKILCQIQAYWRLSFDLSSIIWCFLISYALYISIFRSERNLERFQTKFLLVGYLVPILFSLAPLFLNDFGENTYYCWINDVGHQLNNYLYQLAYYYAPLWLAVIFIFVFNIRVFQQITERMEMSEIQLKGYKKIMRFPGILIFCGFFSTVCYILYVINFASIPQWLQILTQGTFRSQGFLNALAYGIFPIIKQKILGFFSRESEEEKPKPSLCTQYTIKSETSNNDSQNKISEGSQSDSPEDNIEKNEPLLE